MLLSDSRVGNVIDGRNPEPNIRQSRIQSARQSQLVVDLCYSHHIQMQYCYYSAQLTSEKNI